MASLAHRGAIPQPIARLLVGALDVFAGGSRNDLGHADVVQRTEGSDALRYLGVDAVDVAYRRVSVVVSIPPTAVSLGIGGGDRKV
jgi:hypothetical protein